MPRATYSWEELCTFDSEEAAMEFVEVEFCCSLVTHTDPYRHCLICLGVDHLMVERQLKCTSKTCKAFGQCTMKLKTWQCNESNRSKVFHNSMAHVRDETTLCEGPHKSVITSEMKKFILQQDECGISPQLILSNMRHVSDIIEPKRGYPTLAQLTNCAKYLRRLKGTKYSDHAVKQLMREHAFDPTGDLNKTFFFGVREDEDGHAYVGKGTDEDSFVIGATSRALVSTSLEYASPSRYTLFHADATFKLSDLGYPVITCGFSDATRSYQLAAIFVVSRRTATEYAMCLSALTRVIKIIRPIASFHIDAIMGDAEDAQLNGFQQVGEFPSATYLNCFFHVLYNVRKRTRHLSPVHRKAVTDGILRIHHITNMNSYYSERDEVLATWRAVPQLQEFVKYFTAQWIDSRFWRWQIFHTPSGYATTNNPCETFNALLKRYTGRRRYYMQRLLRVSQIVIQDAVARTPAAETQIQQPAPFMARAASTMITLERVLVHSTENPSLCRVKQLHKDEATEAKELEDLCCALDGPFNASSEAELGQDILILGPALLVREQRARAAQLYKSVVTWSLWYAHISGMPEGGWIVDVEKCVCGCKFYSKHKTCCHVIVGRKAKKLGKPGSDDVTAKLFNRQIRKAKSSTKTQSAKKQKRKHAAANKAQAGDQQEDGATTGLSDPLHGPVIPLPLFERPQGRPLSASRALDVQFILCPDT